MKEAFSREVSFFVGTEPEGSEREGFSREFSLLITTPTAPERVTQLVVTVSPTGETATLDWSGYNELLQRDVVRYQIYIATQPFTSVAGLTPNATVPAGTKTHTVTGLTAWQDHYFAVVAVDALENLDETVDYSAAYVLAPEATSREFSIFVGSDEANPYSEAISREISFLITTPTFPEKVTQLTVVVSPTGSSAVLNWAGYNELVQRDVIGYRVYVQTTPFENVTGLTPFRVLPAGTSAFTVEGLTEWQDHYFAVVAEDPNGFDPVVEYSASYVLAPEAVSREVSFFVGSEEGDAYGEAVSRELSILVPDSAVPAPVTGLNSGFDSLTSVSAFSALDLIWPNYNELAQRDVVRYRIYRGNSFFDSVVGMEPAGFAPSGVSQHTFGGLHGGAIYYVAVVAEDLLGNFNPVVRSVSGKASIGALGEVRELTVASFADALHFAWLAPEQEDAFLSKHHVYFNGSATPIILPAAARSYQATGLQPATGYSFRISTVDTFGTESAGVLIVAATWLPHPGNVAGQSFDGMARLTWSHAEPNDLVKHYAVYSSATDFSSVAGLTPVLTTRELRGDVTGLANGQGRFLAVTTVNIVGGENPSVQTVAVTPNPVPGDFADLKASNLASPASAYQGEIITVTWTVSNEGNGATSLRNGSPVDAWTDRVVLSLDEVFGDADDLVLGSVPRSGTVSAGGSYSGNATVTVPIDLLGDYFLFVATDAGDAVYEHLDGGPNITQAVPIEITPAAPDLIAQQLTANASETALVVEWKTLNRGSASATGPWSETVSVSPNPDGAGAQVLLTETVNGPLATTAEISRSATLAAPALSGTYYVIVQVDSQNQIAEASGEDNNRTIVAVTRLQCVYPPSGLLGWWRGEGNASDESGGN
ncbi:MAG: hypothetical protein L0Z50_41690, partial [Verrucomicrobiales bacterium]|nr:hypothetical protein [Verrucomicrobiales bacterium]